MTASKPRILLVDDEYKILFTLKSILEKEGYDVQICLYGIEAVNAIAEQKGQFDLLILDYIMPGMRGDEVARRVKEVCPDLPILFISAFEIPEEARKLASGLLAKPESLRALLELIRTTLEKSGSAMQARAGQ